MNNLFSFKDSRIAVQLFAAKTESYSEFKDFSKKPMNILKAITLTLFAAQSLILDQAKDPTIGADNFIMQSNAIDNVKLRSTSSNRADSDLRVKLIQPDSASQVTSFTPTFVWHSVKTNGPIEYRLLIAKIDGRVIFDKWIGADTSQTIASPNTFEDLNPYYWTVYASSGDWQVQSSIWSFWIDQNKVTDLAAQNLVLEQEKSQWKPGEEIKITATVQNSGPIVAEGCYVILYSGNTNRNYFNYAAHRKTIALDTVFIQSLPLNKPQTITLSTRLPSGFNHFFIRIDPDPGLKDVLYSNNFNEGIKIQTENRLLALKCLCLIYPNYLDPESGEKKLIDSDLNVLQQNITAFQRYFWDHTHIIQIQVDTLVIDRMLSVKNFTYQNDQMGFYLSPLQINQDLKRRSIAKKDYDFVYVYYSWWNTKSTWSGYSGYTFKEASLFKQKVPFLAQPVVTGQVDDEKTAIHELLHLFDNIYEANGERRFYSPHHRMLYSTFDRNEEFYEWMLETWPTDRWFDLKIGQIIPRQEAIWSLDPFKKDIESKALILSQNYPNPFNKITAITYRIPTSASRSGSNKVRLVIYDLWGNRIRTIVDYKQNPGTFRVYWDGKDQQGNVVSSGIYFYALTADEQRQVKKLLFIR